MSPLLVVVAQLLATIAVALGQKVHNEEISILATPLELEMEAMIALAAAIPGLATLPGDGDNTALLDFFFAVIWRIANFVSKSFRFCLPSRSETMGVHYCDAVFSARMVQFFRSRMRSESCRTRRWPCCANLIQWTFLSRPHARRDEPNYVRKKNRLRWK